MNKKLIQEFEKARDYLLESTEERVSCYLYNIWDPLIGHVIVKELYNIIDKELEKLFPSLPRKFFPRCKFRVFSDEQQVEASIQYFFNPFPNLTYLGHSGMGSEMYDFYCKKSANPYQNFVFYARYGHDTDSQFKGTKEAESEYNLGIPSPLSVAYGMALHDGYV